MKITESQSQVPRWEPIDTLCLRALCGSTIQHFTSMKVDKNSIPPTKKLVWSVLKGSCTYYTSWNIVRLSNVSSSLLPGNSDIPLQAGALLIFCMYLHALYLHVFFYRLCLISGSADA